MSVFLVGSICPNEKNYYYIDPTKVGNGSQLISIVLTAKAAKKKVRFFADNTLDSTHCYIRGIWMQD